MPEGESLVVRARGLVKHYGDVIAVDGIDLSVPPGICLGILGPNGAGKTTTIEMLEGLTRPDGGEIEVLGLDWQHDADAIRQRIGVQLQETRLQEKLSAYETLRMFRAFYREVRDLDEVLAVVGLSEKRDARVENLSGGQHQRLSLACALVNRPDLLFLDEPTTGLDPQARRRVWEIVETFKAGGGSVVLTTHYMEEAERLADEVLIVDHGRVIESGAPQAMIGRLEAESIVELHPLDGSAEALADEVFATLPGVREVRREGAAITLVVTDTQDSVGALLAHLARESIELETLHTHRPTLEDVFMALTGKHLRDE